MVWKWSWNFKPSLSCTPRCLAERPKAIGTSSIKADEESGMSWFEKMKVFSGGNFPWIFWAQFWQLARSCWRWDMFSSKERDTLWAFRRVTSSAKRKGEVWFTMSGRELIYKRKSGGARYEPRGTPQFSIYWEEWVPSSFTFRLRSSK